MTKTENDTIPTPPLPSVSDLGPGQAKVSGQVVSIKENILNLWIESIHAYGSATPPIVANDTLSIQVGRSTAFKEESNVVIIIQHDISSDSSKSPVWSLIKLTN